MKIIVVGGVALGASFATRMRRLDENARILIFEKSSYISYANCGLPYNLSETITRDRLILVTPEEMKSKFNIDAFVDTEVFEINKEEKYVVVRNLKTGEERKETYDKLILGPGTRATKLSIPGFDEEKAIFSLKNVNELDAIKDYMKNNKVENVAIFGAGFIGLEVAESLQEAGKKVSVIELASSILKLDKDFSVYAENELSRHGVNLHLNAETLNIDSSKKIINLKDGTKISYDMIISSAGIKPNTEFIAKAGVEVDNKGIVVTNEYLQTSDTNIYAGGDIVYSPHIITGKKVYSPLAWGANRQAKVIANHIAGIQDKQPATSQTAIIKLFTQTIAQTGLTEKEAQALNLNYDIAIIAANHHAGYYPGAEKVHLKLVFDKDNLKVLGAQAIGPSADKKIDVIATAIYGKLTIEDLVDLNLSYSPPYGSAKDIINVVGAIALNKVQRNFEDVKGVDIKNDSITIDVRPSTVFELGSLPQAKNIPLEGVRNSKELPEDKNAKISVCCDTGLNSYNCLSILKNQGYTNVENIAGGYKHYQENNKASKPINNKVEEKVKTMTQIEEKDAILLDCSGLSCPGPLLKLKEKLDAINDGEAIRVKATDFGFAEDIKTWAVKNGHTVLNVQTIGNKVEALIVKGNGLINDDTKTLARVMTRDKEYATIVLFSGDYDKAIAALIIAQAAASLGKKVSIFTTFWGLNSVRVKPKKRPKKKFMKKMFGLMMPEGVEKLPLSKMQMGGIGKAIIKQTMKKHNVKTPGEMMEDALKMGVEIIACTMSMDLLGITKEEILPGVTFAGAAKYISQADDSNITLFI